MKSVIGIAAACALGGLLYNNTAGAETVVRWIQLGPGSSPTALQNGSYGDQPSSATPTILARAIITGGACPALTLDHNANLSITMNARFDGTTLQNLPVDSTVAGYPSSFAPTSASQTSFGSGDLAANSSWTECEAVVPAGHTVATLDGVDLKLPVANPKRILVIGDTGCRLNSPGAQQNCHDPAAFPLAFLASYEALFQPDLIIHVGDYFYRDSSCILNGAEFVPGCTNPSSANFEPWGDIFDSWNGDLFFPGQPLLAAAPWVMTRGNHESCGRGARGWFAFLDPHPYSFSQVACRKNAGNAKVTGTTPVYTGDFTPTYVVPAGAVNLLVHDSSFANDAAVDANMAKNYDLDITGLLNTIGLNGLNFYVTHKPTYGLVSGAPTNGGDFTEQFTFSGNASANSAFQNGVPSAIAMFLSGHIHQFEYVNFQNAAQFAPQLIVGVGGDNLDPTANPNGTSPTYAYQNTAFTVHNSTTTPGSTTVSHAYSQAEFGFAVLDATATGYVASVYNVGASRAGRCSITLNPRSIACWQ
jgi:hypothetical protein